MNDGMDDIELLKLENKALRFQNETLKETLSKHLILEERMLDELHVLRRFRQLVERGAEIVKRLPASLFR